MNEIVCELYKSCNNYFYPLCSNYTYWKDCKLINEHNSKNRQKDSKLEKQAKAKT